jgi:hypothetical protein
MYSRVETLPDTLVQTEIFIDEQRLDVTRLPIWKEATVLHTYKMYNWQKMNNDNDPMDALVKERTRFFPQKVYYYAAYKINNHGEENNRYPQWLKKYLEKQLGKKIATVELKDVQYKYANGQFMPLNSWTVLKIDH